MSRPAVTEQEMERALAGVAQALAEAQGRTFHMLGRLAGIPESTPSPPAATEFVLTRDHITLLRHANVTWSPQEWGGPQIDPKRPFGNGDLWKDVARILDWPAAADGDGYPYYDAAKAIHAELLTALEIVLRTSSFQPGRYVREAAWGSPWRWVSIS